MNLNLKDVSKDTWARTLFLFLSLANQLLAVFGKDTLEFTEDEIYQAVSILATIISTVMAWWKNNSFSQTAQAADVVLKNLNEAKRIDSQKGKVQNKAD